MYIGTLVFMQGAIDVLAFPDLYDPFTVTEADKWWGSIYVGLCSVWMAISGGTDWSQVVHPLQKAGEAYFLMFVLFIAFLTLVVLNIMTGIFVEHASRVAQNDRDQILFDHDHRAKSFERDVRGIFKQMDSLGAGTIDWNKFQDCMQDAKMDAFLEALGINRDDASFFFMLLSQQSEQFEVDSDLFLKGCQRLTGGPGMIDVQFVSCQVTLLAKALVHFVTFCAEQFQNLSPD